MKNLCFLVIALLFFQCKKSENLPEKLTANEFKTLIFGSAYSECSGNCAVIFKLEDGKLYLDEEEYFPYDGKDIKFTSATLTAEKLQAIQDFQKKIPAQLITPGEESFGCPDCADQGLYYLEFETRSGVKGKKMIDPYLEDFKDFCQEIRETLLLLNP